MTVTWRDLVLGIGGAVLVVGLALAVRLSGGDGGPAELVTAENPLVIEPPSLRVVAGSDTSVIFGPTVFVFIGAATEEGEPPRGAATEEEDPPRGFLETAEAFSAALARAQDGLAAMGVKMVSVEAPPMALGVPPEVGAASGPPIPTSGVGILLADGRGRIKMLDRLADGATLVCAAVATFRLPPPPSFDGVCPP